MTSSNGQNFLVTGPLCEEFTGHRWIPLPKASEAELWCFLWSVPWITGWVNDREAGDLRRHRAHYDIIVMSSNELKRLLGYMAWYQDSSTVCMSRTGLLSLTSREILWNHGQFCGNIDKETGEKQSWINWSSCQWCHDAPATLLFIDTESRKAGAYSFETITTMKYGLCMWRSIQECCATSRYRGQEKLITSNRISIISHQWSRVNWNLLEK